MNKLLKKFLAFPLCFTMGISVCNANVFANETVIQEEAEQASIQYVLVEKPVVGLQETQRIFVSLDTSVQSVSLMFTDKSGGGREQEIVGKPLSDGMYVFEKTFDTLGTIHVEKIKQNEEITELAMDISFDVKDIPSYSLPSASQESYALCIQSDEKAYTDIVTDILLQNEGFTTVSDPNQADYTIELVSPLASVVYYPDPIVTKDIETIQNECKLNGKIEQNNFSVLPQGYYAYVGSESDANQVAELILNTLTVETTSLEYKDVAEGKYTIQLQENPQYVVDVKWGSTDDGANIRLYSSNGTGAQIWNVVQDAKGNVSFVCEKSNKALTLNGTNIEQQTFKKTDSQKWQVLEDGRIVSLTNPELYINYEGSVLENGTNLYVDGVGRSFVFKEYDPKRDALDTLARNNRSVVSDRKYTIRSSKNNTYGIRMDASNAELYVSSENKNHAWQVRHDEIGYVSFINEESQEALTVDQAANSNNVYGKTFEDTYNQKWIVLADGTIVSALDENFVLDLHHGSVVNESNIQVYTSNGTSAQKWQLVWFDENREALNQMAKDNQNNIANGKYAMGLASNPNYVIDVKWASTEDGANIRLYSNNGTNAQRWQVSHDENGYVTFTCIHSGKVLAANGNNIEQQTKNHSYAQKWIVLTDGTIVSALDSSLFISYEGTSLYDGVNVEFGEKQAFTFETYDPDRDALDALAGQNRSILSDGKYFIRSGKNSNYVLSIFGSNVELNESNNSKGQIWNVSHDKKGYVTFTNAYTNEVLSIAGNDAKNSQNVELRALDDSYGQKWIVLNNGTIVSALHQDFVLDLYHAAVVNGSNIQVYTSNGTLAQKWLFEVYDEKRATMDQLAKENRNVLANDTYLIQSKKNPSFVADVKWGSKDNGANVRLYQSNDSGAQKWRVTHDEKGYVTFTCANSKKVLTVNNGNVEQATNQQLLSQKWVVLKNGTIISALDPDFVLDIDGDVYENGVNMQIGSEEYWNFVVTNSFDIDAVKHIAQNVVRKYGGDVSVYFKDLNSDESFMINNHYMYPCCMVKTAVLATVYHRASLGLLNLSAYKSDLYYLITYSDNTAYNNILRRMGNGNGVAGAYIINDYMKSLGIYQVELHHGLRPGNGYFTDGGSNAATPYGIGQVFEKIYNGEICNAAMTQEMIDLLCGCLDNTALQQGLPANVPFAHKTGCAYALYHDGGIVYCKNQPYIIVVFTDEVYNRTALFTEISRAIYNFESSLS